MYTDWLLVRRLAWELQQRFAGAKVRDVGQLDDGRFGLVVWTRGGDRTICIDPFAPTPSITVEDAQLQISAEPGFVRAAGAALRGSTLASVRSRTGDRLVRFDFATRSRFGVEDGYSLICELVPRFGNIVLVKGERVVSAAKEFSAAQNARRTVRAGNPYEPPPLREGNATPLLAPNDAARLANQPPEGDLYVYERDGVPVQAHLAPLEKYRELHVTRESSLLDVLARARAADRWREQSDRLAKRRRSIARALERREHKALAELAQARAALRATHDRERLREQADAIYATLHQFAAHERDAKKQRAAELFAAYKKAGASVEHLHRRIAALESALRDAQTLRWELERVDDAQLEDVAVAAGLEKPRAEGARSPRRTRKPLTVTTVHGSRIIIGRTPLENAELTFHVARPDDLWFHVQNQPGAHVIVQRHEKGTVPKDDIQLAAAFAAYHSKAKNNTKVTVDYTQRKHVRKRPGAAPGLVFYTNPSSVVVAPKAPKETANET